MAEAFVVHLASGLLSRILSLVAEELIQAWGLEENLEALRERLELVDALLSDADIKQVTMNTVQVWLNKLKDISRVADALMDKLAYEVIRQKMEKPKVRNLISLSKNSILYRFKMSHKIKNINVSLDKIYEGAEEIGLGPAGHMDAIIQQNEICNTIPFVDDSPIVGRDGDVSELVKMLCNNNEKELPVIAVVGMGGLGKTTLARIVYGSDVVMSFFKKQMWVTVSDDFNVMRLLNEMVQSLTATNSLLSNPEAVIKKLQKVLKGDKFLLVLDDVWNESSEEWDHMRNSLLGVGGVRGSKILVTTRSHEVIGAMQACLTHQLLGLSYDNSWALFKQRAFAYGGALENDDFEAICRRMVERCGGLPLALKALGSLLFSKKSKQEWLSIQDSDIWVSKDVLPSLRIAFSS